MGSGSVTAKYTAEVYGECTIACSESGAGSIPLPMSKKANS